MTKPGKAELTIIGLIMATFTVSLYWAWYHSNSASVFRWALYTDTFAVLSATLYFNLGFYNDEKRK